MISNLRDVPQFADTAASHCWHEWWQGTNVTLAQYRSWYQDAIDSDGIPETFVAHDGSRFQGCVSLIANDLMARPNLTPWIAALWVDPEFRRQGLAQALIAAARLRAQELGVAKLYLCATPASTPYYLRCGFSEIERDVDELTVFAIGAND